MWGPLMQGDIMQGDLIVTLHDGTVDHMGDGLCNCAHLLKKWRFRNKPKPCIFFQPYRGMAWACDLVTYGFNVEIQTKRHFSKETSVCSTCQLCPITLCNACQ